MKVNRIVSGIVLAFAVMSIAVADEASSLRNSMQSMTNKYVAAFLKGDTATMRTSVLTGFSENFVFKMMSGQKMNRDEWLTMEIENMANTKNIKHLGITFHEVNVKGNKAWCSSDIFFEADAKMDPRQPFAHIVMKGKAAVTMVKEGKNGWKIASIVETGGAMWVNGKKMKM